MSKEVLKSLVRGSGVTFRVRLTGPPALCAENTRQVGKSRWVESAGISIVLRDRTAWWSCCKHQEVACGSTFEMHSGTRSVLTGLRAPPEVHREDATTRPERLYEFGIDTDSGPDKYGAVCKDPRGSAYPHPRTGHNRCFRGPLGAAGATREGTAGPAPGAGRVVQLLSYPEH